ncbi:hypothetical protein AJ87_40650 [Rhizobium yanglingense]|nr:hypothetical protein AJ87_40650 [Rhizobium yanglingense]
MFYETIEACHHSLETLSKTIRVADIKAAAEILSSANCVFILAGNGTFPMAALLQHCLTRLRIRSTLLTDIVGGDDVLAFATPDDAASSSVARPMLRKRRYMHQTYRIEEFP